MRDQWIRFVFCSCFGLFSTTTTIADSNHLSHSEAKGFVLVYSITSRRSFERLPIFYQAIRRNRRESNPIIILVGNKSDKQHEREVTKEEGAAKAREFNCPFIETSAKTASNVDRAFGDVLRMVIERYEGPQGPAALGPGAASGGPNGTGPPPKRKKKRECIIA